MSPSPGKMLCMRQVLAALKTPSISRRVNAAMSVVLHICLLLMLGAAVANSIEQLPGSVLWLVPAALMVGPALMIALRVRALRRFAPAIRGLMSAMAFVGAALLGLVARRPDAVIAILASFCGLGWGLWQIDQLQRREGAHAVENKERLARQRHDELLHEVRRARARHRRLAGHARRRRDGV